MDIEKYLDKNLDAQSPDDVHKNNIKNNHSTSEEDKIGKGLSSENVEIESNDNIESQHDKHEIKNQHSIEDKVSLSTESRMVVSDDFATEKPDEVSGNLESHSSLDKNISDIVTNDAYLSESNNEDTSGSIIYKINFTSEVPTPDEIRKNIYNNYENEEGEVKEDSAPLNKTVEIKFPIKPSYGSTDRMSKFSRQKLKKDRQIRMTKTMTELEEQKVRLARALENLPPSNYEKSSIFVLKLKVLDELIERLDKYGIIPGIPERKAVNMKGGIKFLNKYMEKKRRLIEQGDTSYVETVTIKQPVPKPALQDSKMGMSATELETEGLEVNEKKRFVKGYQKGFHDGINALLTGTANRTLDLPNEMDGMKGTDWLRKVNSLCHEGSLPAAKTSRKFHQNASQYFGPSPPTNYQHGPHSSNFGPPCPPPPIYGQLPSNYGPQIGNVAPRPPHFNSPPFSNEFHPSNCAPLPAFSAPPPPTYGPAITSMPPPVNWQAPLEHRGSLNRGRGHLAERKKYDDFSLTNRRLASPFNRDACTPEPISRYSSYPSSPYPLEPPSPYPSELPSPYPSEPPSPYPSEPPSPLERIHTPPISRHSAFPPPSPVVNRRAPDWSEKSFRNPSPPSTPDLWDESEDSNLMPVQRGYFSRSIWDSTPSQFGIAMI